MMFDQNRFRFVLASFLFVFLAASAAPAQSARRNFNRARTFDVQHYVLRVGFDAGRKTVFGDTTVQLKPLAGDFKTLELDAADLKFESVTIEPENKNVQFRTAGDKIVLTLDRAYSASDTISLRFKYSTKPQKGVYFVEAQTENGKPARPAQIWTQGEPEEARHWFPSYDFPDDKATTEQFITVAKNEIAVGNGEPLPTVENADGTRTFHFRMPVPHSTYLTSFVVGDYVKISDSYKNIPLGFYTYRGTEAAAKTAYGRTKEMMRVFEELTGVAFPYNKYDQTVVANFTFGGMENITATTMADTEIFLNQPGDVDDLVAHELAHSWFGDLVTCRNWAELWLNEGFATYLEAAYREKTNGRADYLRKIREDAKQFMVDAAVNRNPHALFNETARPDDSLFDVTTYQKGGAVIHTLRETVGAENFWRAINIYLNRHRFKNVETADLQKAMEEASKTDLDWFFKQWVYGGGYPKLKIERRYDAATKTLDLTVAQTQTVNRLAPEPFQLPLTVEITTPGGARDEKLLIKKREEKFSFKLDGAPTAIVFDKDEKIPLKTIKMEPLKNAAGN